jgi:hypothetical protein
VRVLACPTCGEVFGDEERFCPRCGVPLVPVEEDGDAARPTRLQERIRKVKPQYAEGELVRVARAHHQAEAELLQNMLLEEGIPSTTRRSMGFDVPDFMAAGPRDVLVPRSGADAARDVLEPNRSGRPGDPREV